MHRFFRGYARAWIVGSAAMLFLWTATLARDPSLSPSHGDNLLIATFGEGLSRDGYEALRTPCGEYHRNGAASAAQLAAVIAVADVRHGRQTLLPAQVKSLTECAKDAVHSYLQRNPASSLAWAQLAELERGGRSDAEQRHRYLARSVELAPREAWMAYIRAPLAHAELAIGKAEWGQSDYVALIDAELFATAAALLNACLAIKVGCDREWNSGLSDRQIARVSQEMMTNN